MRAELNLSFYVNGDKAWIVTGEFELFGKIREFFYVISDKTGKVEYTFDELGNRDPHIKRSLPKKVIDEKINVCLQIKISIQYGIDFAFIKGIMTKKIYISKIKVI